MIFVNFKSGYEGTGKRALALISQIAEAQKETKAKIIPVVHDFDVYPVRQTWDGELWIQHIDTVFRATGKNSIEAVASVSLGILGTFLNHSECKFSDKDMLGEIIYECQNLGLKTVVFAGSEAEIGTILGLKNRFGKTVRPRFLAYEPPELIASTKTSVAKAYPEIIAAAVKIVKEAGVPLLVGAGIKDKDDVRRSCELGAVGVVASSAVLTAKNQKAKILELASGFSL